MGDASVPSSKRCCTCKQLRQVDEFHRNTSRKDGLQTQCKPCHTLSRHANDDRKPAQPTPAPPKYCGGCKTEKPADPFHFSMNRARADGLQDQCRPCAAAAQKGAYARRKERERRIERGEIILRPEPVQTIKVAPPIPAGAFSLYDFSGGQQGMRFALMYENALRIVKTYREAWPAIEEITQGWGAPCSP